MKNTKMKMSLGCMLMTAFLLAGCDKAEEGKAALSIGVKTVAPKSEEQEYMEAFKHYLAHKAEGGKKIADCSSKRREISMKRINGKDITASDRARLTELNTGACKAAEDAHYESWHAEQKVPQMAYRPTRGAIAAGQGASSMRELKK